jgi:hypothetical protein
VRLARACQFFVLARQRAIAIDALSPTAALAKMRPMPDFTRRADGWLVYHGDVHVGTIARHVGHPGAVEARQWQCGLSTALHRGRLSGLDDQQAWTAKKYRRFDRGKRMPPD